MKNETLSASQEIAKEMKIVFGSEAKTISVKIKHKRVVGNFVRKIEKAHQNAAKSNLIFG